VKLAKDGRGPAEVAGILGVHPVTVSKWLAKERAGGAAALAARPVPGRPRALTPAQEAEALGWLAEPAAKHGFATDLWTAARFAQVLERRLGVRYHPGYVRTWLAERRCSPQKPARPARQRDEPAIQRWKRADWRRLKKTPRGGAPG
jgi:transposase